LLGVFETLDRAIIELRYDFGCPTLAAELLRRYSTGTKATERFLNYVTSIRCSVDNPSHEVKGLLIDVLSFHAVDHALRAVHLPFLPDVRHPSIEIEFGPVA
jgi:hypothetical protein